MVRRAKHRMPARTIRRRQTCLYEGISHEPGRRYVRRHRRGPMAANDNAHDPTICPIDKNVVVFDEERLKLAPKVARGVCSGHTHGLREALDEKAIPGSKLFQHFVQWSSSTR